MPTAVDVRPTRYFEDILKIVDGIYAAACGETPWERTIAALCDVGKLDGCALSMVDPLERRRVVVASYGLTCAAEPHAAPGPTPGHPLLTESALQSTPGVIWPDRRIMSGALPTTTQLWTDWMRSKDLVAWACVIVGRHERHVVCLEVYAGVGRASSGPGLDDLLWQLAPHLTRAWRLGRTSRSMLAAPSSAAPASHCHGELPEVVRLRAAFGLTKAEARLALRLTEGSSLASAAHAFNVKLSTIRSQLQQVFAKTGTSRQTELVAMLLGCGYASRRPPWSPYRPLPAEAAVAG